MSTRLRSPDYPSLSLRQAVDLVSCIYTREHTAQVDLNVAAKHLGHTALNGASRIKLASLRKFGLVEYVGASGLRVTGLAERILTPRDESEKLQAAREALERPKLYAWIMSEYGGWRLPSDDNLHARLVRDLKFNPKATANCIAALRESVDYVESLTASSSSRTNRVSADREPRVSQPLTEQRERPQGAKAGAVDIAQFQSDGPHEDSEEPRRDVHVLSVPGAKWSVTIPGEMAAAEARRMLTWIERVLKPYLEFVADEVTGEPPQ